MTPTLRLYDASGRLRAAPVAPRKLEAVSGLGALPAECRLELLPRDAGLPVARRDRLRVEIEGRALFDGPVVELRADTLGRLRGLRGLLLPELDWNERVWAEFQDTTVGETLAALIANLAHSPVNYAPSHAFDAPLDALCLEAYPLFYAIDLLAKLAGNAAWEVGWDAGLRFRPFEATPDHALYYDARRHALKVWAGDEAARNSFTARGGIVAGNEFVRHFSDPESVAALGPRPMTLFMRPITTEAAYQQLRAALLAEATRPRLRKYVDVFEASGRFRAGDLLELRGSPLPEPGGDRVVRIKQVETLWTAERARTRLWLAEGRENARSYLSYLDHEHTGPDPDWVRRRAGVFTLDFSALDSAAHLDA